MYDVYRAKRFDLSEPTKKAAISQKDLVCLILSRPSGNLYFAAQLLYTRNEDFDKRQNKEREGSDTYVIRE